MSQSRYVIIHADDAGMSRSVNAATIKSLEAGLVTSASVLVPAPRFLEFADYARVHNKTDVGLHLALTSEWGNYRWGPVSPRAKVPSLLDRDGFLWSTVADVARYVDVRDAATELTAQIEYAVAAGINFSHIDTHEGALFMRHDLVDLYMHLATTYMVPPLVPREHLRSSRLGKAFRPHLKQLRKALNCARVPVLADVFQIYNESDHEARRQRYREKLGHLREGVSQVIVHCGFDDPELRSITRLSAVRASDFNISTDVQMRDDLDKAGVIRINWKQFRALCSGDLT